jgi:hypothetical protein
VLFRSSYNKQEKYCGHAPNHTEWYDEHGSELIDVECVRFEQVITIKSKKSVFK